MQSSLHYKAEMLKRTLIGICIFTGTASMWLAGMDLLVRHAGYVERVWMAAFFVAQSLTTIMAFAATVRPALRALALPGSVVIACMGVRVVFLAGRDRDVEGYVLLIGLALILQAVLVFAAMFWRQPLRTESARAFME
jgi:ABC-type polysaccharide/polyol phosphate export permease